MVNVMFEVMLEEFLLDVLLKVQKDRRHLIPQLLERLSLYFDTV